MKMELNKLTVKQAQKLLNDKQISSLELTRACLARIKKIDNKVKACLSVTEELALEMAKKADQRRKKGAEGKLLGIPMLVKDNIMAKGTITTAGSKILENYLAPFDATVVKKLKQAGAVILGKTNLDEFGHGASTENSAFGPTHNPWDLSRVPGGSSGGSAAAVAADMCSFALSTDTGGSTRFPAGLCGVVGLKPTYGRNSRFGLMAMTSSTDVAGVITKTVVDAALVAKIMAGQDSNDATTMPRPVPDYGKEMKRDLAGIKIGKPKEYYGEGITPGVRAALDEAAKELKKLGAKIIDINLPHTKYVIPVYYIITPAEISSNLARFDGIKYGLSAEGKNLAEVYFKTRGQGFGPEAKRRIMLGTYALSAGYYDAYYLQAQKVRTKIVDDFNRAWRRVDVIFTPTSPHAAFKIGEHSSDPLEMYLEDVFVAAASLAGLPALSVPAGFDRGLPVGMQLIGKKFAESMLFRIGHQYQQATCWQERKPIL